MVPPSFPEASPERPDDGKTRKWTHPVQKMDLSGGPGGGRPEHLDPAIVLWSWCHHYLEPERLPRRRVVVRYDFRSRPKRTLWVLLENGRGEVCRKHPGFAEDLVVDADPEWFVKWHMGWRSWAQAVREGHITVEGPRDLARALPSWNRKTRFQSIKPAFATGPARAI